MKWRINALCLAGITCGISAFFLAWGGNWFTPSFDHVFDWISHNLNGNPNVYLATLFVIGTLAAIITPLGAISQAPMAVAAFYFSALQFSTGNFDYAPTLVMVVISFTIIVMSIFKPIWKGPLKSTRPLKDRLFTFWITKGV